MPIFDNVTRRDSSFKARTESAFGFFNRAARPEFEEVRRRLESWFGRYPSDHASELRQRLRTDDDAHHNAAVFELFVHELLVGLGWEVEVHPSIPGTTSFPDFRATMDGETILVEATEVRPRNSILASDPLEEDVLGAIDELDSPNFFLNIVKTGGHLTKAPRRSQVVAPFREFMSAYDPDDVADLIRLNGPSASPTKRVESGDWYIEASLIPRFKSRGSHSSRTIGVGPFRGGWVNDSASVRDELRRKGKKYGKPGLPLIVAVNAPAVDNIDEVEALFGKEQFTFIDGDFASPPRMTRAPDGLWVGHRGNPNHTRLSGAWIFRGIAPWSVGAVPNCLYVNPFATHPIPRSLMVLAHAVAVDGELVRNPGVDLADVLGLQPLDHSTPVSNS